MAQMAARACQWLGVAVETMSTDLSSNASRMSLTNLGLRPCFLLDRLGPLLADLLVGIDDVGDLGVVVVSQQSADVIAAAAVDADDHRGEFFVRAFALCLVGREEPADRHRRHRRGGQQRVFQKAASCVVRHECIPPGFHQKDDVERGSPKFPPV